MVSLQPPSGRLPFLRLVGVFCYLLGVSAGLQAMTPSQEVTQRCRANLQALTDATTKWFGEQPGRTLTTWSDAKAMARAGLVPKHLAKLPEGPTADCGYALLFENSKAFVWYCHLHGCLSGDEKVSIRYHEYGFSIPVSSRWKHVTQYRDHVDFLRRWSNYEPSVIERIKFSYHNNFLTTVIVVAFGLVVLVFLYRCYLA